MKKILSVFMLALVLVGLAGCGGERTYKADGTYVAWKLSTHDVNFDGETVTTPAYVTVEVTIAYDEIVKFNIDERQAHVFVGPDRHGNEVQQIAFNERTKKELFYDYGMEASADKGEWFIQAGVIERAWLENDKIEAVSASTMHQDAYVEVALEAVQNAKDGKVGAIHFGEHYAYDVVWVTGDIDEEGKISDVAFDAHMFVPAEGKWNDETKYESYPEMAGGAKWQDQLDTFTEYINENGWNAELQPNANLKGVNKAGEDIEALTSVTMEVKGEILVMNKLHSYFPRGF